ncbi:hypothetical protein K2X85_16360, partial [bacterium]|nr:hypothetical protein [bacterium]
MPNPREARILPKRKTIRAIPLGDLCQHCKRGRMITEGTRRKISEGEFDSIEYRRCDHCGHKAKT